MRWTRTVTRWAALVGDEWRVVAASTAAAIAGGTHDRPKNIRLMDVRVRMSIKFVHWYRYRAGDRPITPRRLAAAAKAKAIDRQIESAGLFQPMAVAEAPTPLERVQRAEAGLEASTKERRQRRADDWRSCRRRLRELPEALRIDVLEFWQRGWYPAHPYYLSNLLNRAMEGSL